MVTRLHTYIEKLDARTGELAEALEAKTSFLSHCSHELRTPLSAIMVGWRWIPSLMCVCL
jgi:signal transduction histidine kinase